jgi:hypothetical protein
MMMHDPVLAALGMSQQAGQEMMYQAALYDGSENPVYEWSADPAYDTDPGQYAWYQAQALATAAWQLQQAASWQAQVASTCSLGHDYADAVVTLPASSTPRGAATTPLEITPAKTAPNSDASTELGSPVNDESSDDEDSDVVAAQALQAWLSKEIEGAMPNNPPPPPPVMPATKLDLHAIIFENAKDPHSTALLQLIKGDGKQKGQELLAMIKPASGASKQTARAHDETEGYRRRRPRGARGGRSSRH